MPLVSHALTPAGTVIRNQAAASYTDTEGRRVSVTSNVVETRVEQVASLELTADQSLRAVGGNTVRFSHRIENTGNGEDRYTLSAANSGGDSRDLSALAVYADADADGLPDDTTPIGTTPWVAAGDEFYVVVEGRLPETVTDGDSAILVLTATSAFDTGESRQNRDTVTAGVGAALSVVKSYDVRQGPSPSGPVRVELRYENTGTQAAGDLVLIDTLPDGMRYVQGSARWSGSSSALTDADPNDTHTGAVGSLRFCAYDASCNGLPEADLDNDVSAVNQVTAVIDLVPAGAVGRLSFEVTIEADLAVGVLDNQAEYEYDIAIGTVPRAYSNSVGFRVLASAGVVANGSTATAFDGMNEPVSVGSAAQGGSVQFDNIIWNTGNRRDTFDIEVDAAGSSFPAGTLWRLYRGNGATPLTDSDGNGRVDTGPIEPGDFSRVVMRLELPAELAGNNGGAGFDIAKIARSSLDAGVSNVVIDHLDEIIANQVDITNQAPAGDANALGTGPGPEASPISTGSVDANGESRFDLYIRHQGAGPDRYRLSAYGTPTGGPLPDGWRVRFLDPATGVPLQNTGSLASGASRHVEAVVTVVDGQSPVTASVYFEARSPLTGAVDVKHDAVVVGAASTVRIEPGLSAQLQPGGHVVYKHVVSNDGNALIGDIGLDASHTLAGWTSVIHADDDLDGLLGPDDSIQAGTFSLAAGASREFFIKVFAPADAKVQDRNTTTVTANWAAGSQSASVVDLSTITLSHTAIRKEQAPDTGCTGSPDPGTDFSPTGISVAPGNNCVIYRLTAINTGVEPAFNVSIQDTTPPFTVYSPAARCSRTPCWLTEPSPGNTGTIKAETDQLLPGDAYHLEFSVRVQ